MLRRSSSRCALLAATLSLLVLAPRDAHASVDAVVSGLVEDTLLHPLAGVTVVLHDTTGATIAKTVTGADGRFAFPQVPFGDYTVEAALPGLVPEHQHIQLSSSQVADIEL